MADKKPGNKKNNLPKEKLAAMSLPFKERVLSKEEILQRLYFGIKESYGFSGVNIYLFDPVTSAVSITYPPHGLWPLPDSELDWIIKRTKNLLISDNDKPVDSPEYYYISDRKHFLYSDKDQLKIDMEEYQYDCSDMLYLVLISEDEIVMGLVQINNWRNQKILSDVQNFDDMITNIKQFISDTVIALDNLFIHQKIESLISDKHELKQRIRKDEEDLKRRVLELSVLYDTSNALSYSLDYYQIVKLVMDAMYKVLNYDVGAIYFLDVIPTGEIILRIRKSISEDLINSVQTNIIAAVAPFIKVNMDQNKIKVTREDSIMVEDINESKEMKSFANVPLIFKEEVIGILSVCSTSQNAFSRNEMTFLHTLANQLASHMGRLKIVKTLEKSKIMALIESMREGVIMFDDNQHPEIINPAALKLLDITDKKMINDSYIKQKLKHIGIQSIYDRAVNKGDIVLNQDITFNEKVFSVNANPVLDNDQGRIGTALVIKDFTELQKINRVKTQRLEAISKVNLIISSISDLNNLLAVLMQFILNVANTETGSIQLMMDKVLRTQVHSNFPGKVCRNFKFTNGENISDYVSRTKQLCFIEDYMNNSRVDSNIKVIIDSYLCIPIIVKSGLLGIVNIVHKTSVSKQKITTDDLNTLSTITTLIGTAIENAILYQKTISKHRLDQELKIANEIQKKLLPQNLPVYNKINFGAISVPAREIGGDYYDFFKLEGDKIGVVIADIVGKGIPAGLFMAMLKSILHTHIPQYQTPKQALERLNTILYNDPVINKFIPLFYYILDPVSLSIKYCNAGHEPAIIFSNNEFSVLDTNGLPLGALESSDYEEKEVHLLEKDIVLLFTDGIVEAKNVDGRRFGYDGLKKAIKKKARQESSQFVKNIYMQVNNFIKRQDQQDDVTLLALKVEDIYNSDKIEVEAIEVKKLRVTSSKKNIKVVRQQVAVIAKEMGFDDTETFNLKLAVNEAQANVIEHAYLGKEDGEIIFYFNIFNDKLEVVIKDFGSGIEEITIKGEAHLDELEGSGLGVYMIKTLVDKVEYKRIPKVGMELKITKYLNKED